MGFYILLALILTPLVEIAVLIEVGTVIGTLETVLVIVATAILGAFLLRGQGLAVLSRAQASLGRGEMPVTEVFEGLFLVIAGALLLTPGFVTDIIGFVLLVPAARRALGQRIFRHLLARGMDFAGLKGRFGESDEPDTVDGDFREVNPEDRDT